MKNILKSNNGITLITLVITIIVLIILSAIVINLTVGENGIFGKAKRAQQETLIAQAKEKLELKASEIQIEKEGQATLKDFAEYLDKDNATYAIALNKSASVTGGIPNLENAEEMYITYNGMEFKVDKSLKITYVGGTAKVTEGTGGTSTGEGTTGGSTGENGSSSGLTGCRRYIEVDVKDAIMGQMTLSVEIPDRDKVKAIEYYIDGKLVHTGTEKIYTVTGLQAEIDYKVTAIVEYEPDSIVTTAKIQNIGIVSVNSTHTASEQTLEWGTLEAVAKLISDNEGTGEKQVNSDTAGVTFAMGKEQYTIGIGDTFTLDGKKVRLLGFNHDELVDKTVYGGNNTYAGISFEYIDPLIEKEKMRDSNVNEGGWKESNVYTLLNGSAESTAGSQYENLRKIINIKKVKKAYCKLYSSTELSYSEDYIWLLSFNEIYGEGYCNTYAYASAGNEGIRYKYYKFLNPNVDSRKNGFGYTGRKKTWLRSMPFVYSSAFCDVDGYYESGYNSANGTRAVIPGFAI